MSEEVKAPFECIISADIFRRALRAVSKEESRYYLTGVQVEPCEHGGALLIATDGSRMLVLRDPDGIVRNGHGIVSLNRDMVEALSAKADVKKRLVLVRGSKAAVAEVALGADELLEADALLALADSPTQSVGAYQWHGALIDGKFPDWRRVVGKPASKPAPHGAIDPTKLAPLAEALASHDRYSRGCRLVPTEGDEANGPVFVFPLMGDGFGVIMPVRDDSQHPTLPEWIHPASKIAAE